MTKAIDVSHDINNPKILEWRSDEARELKRKFSSLIINKSKKLFVRLNPVKYAIENNDTYFIKFLYDDEHDLYLHAKITVRPKSDPVCHYVKDGFGYNDPFTNDV